MIESQVAGSVETPLLELTTGQALDRAAAMWGDEAALIVPGQDVRWTWRELKHQADAFAAGLLGVGLKPGDRIGIWSLNCAEWTVTQFAAARAGLIIVTINPSYRLSELEFALNKVGCTALVSSTAFKSSDYIGMLRQLAPELSTHRPGQLFAARLPALRTVIQIGEPKAAGTISFDQVASLASQADYAMISELNTSLACDTATAIQFTSGTTGAPKGVTLSHRNILNNGYFVGRGMRLAPSDRICIPVPLYHCFGMVMGNLAALTHGAAMVYPGEGFDPHETLKTVEAERCTALYGVPTMFIAQVDHPDFPRFDLTALRTGIMAGSPCPIELMRRVASEMNMRDITICYGMTETSPVSFQSAVDDDMQRRVSTVGRVHPHVEARVVDEAGRTVSAGQRGELCVRGYSVMLGYWDDSEKTGEVIDADRWMHTGDLATIDAAGYGNIVGRIKDMVIRGGENIYPREVEEYLFRHPAIQDVQVFGVADPKYGEELCAWIRVRDGHALTADDVRAFCRDQIARQKVPRYIEFVREFPMTVTGKIQKFVMRQEVEERLGLRSDATA